MQEQMEQWINEVQYEELVSGTNNSPQKLLGLHPAGDGQIIMVCRPLARKITVTDSRGGSRNELEALDEYGIFGIYLEKQVYKKYRLEIEYGEDDLVITEDPYSFPDIISKDDLYLFGEGKHYQIYEKLGAHPMVADGVPGVHFAVWAPNARSVSVVGTFNMWDGRLHPMRLLDVSGIYELFIPYVETGAIYKFQIMTRDGQMLHKSDPYGNYAEVRPRNASVVTDISHYNWSDEKWIRKRKEAARLNCIKQPMAIYEVHLGSWRKKDEQSEDGFYSYREIAPMLADYVLEMGYTHIELMGISEYPFDGSWGYQVVGYYAPTSRYGSPADFMYFVNYMHQRGIYLILDWVPAHFPKDAHGLARFDGVPLYEHPDPRRGEHPHWGTYIFNYGNKQVENFLIANALFWLEKFHVDGLRVDAVASMLYLDYGKEPGEWLPNEKGGRENTDAILMLQHMNRVLEERVPGALMIAEESTAWAGVTAPVSMNGLGFLFKWNMGWMNDFLEYMKLDPYFRKFNHHKLTFGIMYAYSENFIQVLSHDEVVHGKCSMINKMPGEYEDKFANLRTAYAFMYGHPGKKLLFMGQEFAQWREWSEDRSLDWRLLEEGKNYQMQQYVKALNRLYHDYPAMYVHDNNSLGFEWMDCQNENTSVVVFVRRGETMERQLLFVCNFTPVCREDYQIPLPCQGIYREVLNSDSQEYGGNNSSGALVLEAEEVPFNGRDYSVRLTIPPLSALVFCYDYKKKSIHHLLEKLQLRDLKPTGSIDITGKG